MPDTLADLAPTAARCSPATSSWSPTGPAPRAQIVLEPPVPCGPARCSRPSTSSPSPCCPTRSGGLRLLPLPRCRSEDGRGRRRRVRETRTGAIPAGPATARAGSARGLGLEPWGTPEYRLPAPEQRIGREQSDVAAGFIAGPGHAWTGSPSSDCGRVPESWRPRAPCSLAGARPSASLWARRTPPEGEHSSSSPKPPDDLAPVTFLTCGLEDPVPRLAASRSARTGVLDPEGRPVPQRGLFDESCGCHTGATGRQRPLLAPSLDRIDLEPFSNPVGHDHMLHFRS